ncbi:hypothetical protein CAP35_12825 [Chitinophagaceae bacterium IBVUCB1]|nr:hypothetical protein CAP35_12825 [Chitinophagaceae bacterium IBVUCB1]
MKKLMILFFGVMALSGCYYDKENELYPSPTGGGCDTTTSTFSSNVLPVMQQKCATSGCHATTLPTGYNLSNYEGVKTAVTEGKLLGSIRHQSGFSAMPKGSAKLDDCSINKIARWVNLGMLNN